jgi:hypothetical protein
VNDSSSVLTVKAGSSGHDVQNVRVSPFSTVRTEVPDDNPDFRSSPEPSNTVRAPVVMAKERLSTKFEKARVDAGHFQKEKKPEGAVGTHRFTLSDKEALQLLNGKKLSGRE